MSIYEERESYAVSRAGGLGGTDAAAILNLSPWKKPIDIYAGKVDPKNQPELDNEMLFWGSALEPVVRGRYGVRYGAQVVEPKDIGLFFSNSRPWNDSTLVIGKEDWMLGAPDGWIAADHEGLEIKCSSRRGDEWGAELSDEVPAHYLIQVAWYMAVLDAPAWNFGVLFSGNKLERFRVRRDMDLERVMVEACRAFWHDNVLKKIEPPIDESASYGRYLARKFSLSTGNIIKNPSLELTEAAMNLKTAQDAVKEAEAAEQLRKNQLAALLADADAALTPFGKVAWMRPAPRRSTDWKAVTEEANVPEDVIAKHTKESPVTPYVRGYWKK